MARVGTSAGDGRRVEGMYSKRSSGGGEGEPRERNRRVAEQRDSAFARAPSLYKCSTRRKSGEGGHHGLDNGFR